VTAVEWPKVLAANEELNSYGWVWSKN
jgi:hypothetical protein